MVISVPVHPDRLIKCNPASLYNSSGGDTATVVLFLQALLLYTSAALAVL